ncbi:hypothetical protein Gogos_006931, partial [Gossypium gossypioides]|nr:hypothetical protein [Gossypium gossypioides]
MPPIESFIRVNFDVGFLYGLVRRVLGLSSEIGAASDGVVGAACFWKSHVPTPLEVEAWACLEVIRFAVEIDFRRVEFEGDSLLVITKMKSTGTDRSDINMLIWEAKLKAFTDSVILGGSRMVPSPSTVWCMQSRYMLDRRSAVGRDDRVFLPLELGNSTISLNFRDRGSTE